MLEMRIHGLGGQGAVTLAQLIATAGLASGKTGQALPSFGTERRGSAVQACVRLADGEIKNRSQCVEPDLLIFMSNKLVALGIGEGIKPTGKLLLNTSRPEPENYPFWYLDADKIATEMNLVVAGVPFINIPIFGAVCKVLDISATLMQQVLEEKWQGPLGQKNVKAALMGYEQVRAYEDQIEDQIEDQLEDQLEDQQQEGKG